MLTTSSDARSVFNSWQHTCGVTTVELCWHQLWYWRQIEQEQQNCKKIWQFVSIVTLVNLSFLASRNVISRLSDEHRYQSWSTGGIGRCQSRNPGIAVPYLSSITTTHVSLWVAYICVASKCSCESTMMISIRKIRCPSTWIHRQND